MACKKIGSSRHRLARQISDLGNTPKSDNLSKRRIHDAENTSNVQIIVIRCVKCPQLSRISDLGVFRRYRIYRELNSLYKSIHFQAY